VRSADTGIAAARDPIGTHVADVVSQLRRAMRRAARATDPGATLSVAQLEFLSCLAEHPGARPGQIARRLRLAPSSTATLAGGLRAAGLVSRADGEDDRRTASLTLTRAGEVAVRRWQALNERLLRAALVTLGDDDRKALSTALPALRALAGAIDALADAHMTAVDEPVATTGVPGGIADAPEDTRDDGAGH
jgi:DNA-binding MarR family transcriptional regulator